MRLVAVGAMLAALGCTPKWKQTPHDRVFQRAPVAKTHLMPAKNMTTSDWWDYALLAGVVPLGKLVSPARYLKYALGGRVALDINRFGNVPDSPWFENRIGRRPLTPEQMRRGQNRNPGPAPGPLTIISGKLEGATPGLVLRDSKKVVWFVKFDPPAHPELSSGAEVIASRLLWAAGYHVPEIHIVQLSLTRLALAPNAKRRDDYNRRRPLREADLKLLITQLNPSSRGVVRALFSRSVPGRELGPFFYRGTRKDDPNDRIPHQRRRSLRGLKVFSSWINNTDTRAKNTLDTFVARPGKRLGHVRHYLIDFGDALGAAGNREKYVGESHSYRVDWVEMAKGMFALGLYYPKWLRVRRSPFRSVGMFNSKQFTPGRWHPGYPNVAFDELTPLDRFWAAAIIARFTPAGIRAAVATAQYRAKGAGEWIERVLLERRRKLLVHAFAKMEALDRPKIVNRYVLELADLKQLAGITTAKGKFAWAARWNRTGRPDHPMAEGIADGPRIDLRLPLRKLMLKDKNAFVADPFITVKVWRLDRGKRGPRVDVHVRAAYDYLIPVGLHREVVQ